MKRLTYVVGLAVCVILVYLWLHFDVKIQAGCDESGCGAGVNVHGVLPNPMWHPPADPATSF